ncbi:MAG: FtsX-like permease family protein [Defluviitaleaceae bacterium]|nr:FtsX-like permease family protein [Defluviitaleaceae bacterium]
MFLIQNALANLRRNLGRNLLLGVIIFAIIATTAVTLIINNTANGIIEDYKFRFGSRVNIVPDTARIMDNVLGSLGGMLGGGGFDRSAMNPRVTAQQSIAFAQLPYVHSYEMSAFQPAFAPLLYTVDGDADIEIGGGGMGAMLGGGRGGNPLGVLPEINMETLPNLRLYGNSWEDFDAGLRELVAGTFPAVYGDVMISMELAELNGLSVGDVLPLYTVSSAGQTPREFAITGIFFDMTPENATGGFVRASFLNRRNEVLTTLDTVITHAGEAEAGINVTALYYLHDPSYLPYFETAARNLGLDDLLLVTTNEAEYLAIVEPVLGLRNVTQTFMVIVLVLGGIVLVVLASISVRERKYEIGVLRAMGMKKKQLAFGLMTEMFAMTVVCLMLGLTAGSLAAQPISDRLLAAQLESIIPEEAAPEAGGIAGMLGGGRFGQMFGGNTIDAQPLSELDVSLGLQSILQIIAISLLLAALAGLVSIIRITKYEPMKILMERT